jgi:hypothetical protein
VPAVTVGFARPMSWLTRRVDPPLPVMTPPQACSPRAWGSVWWSERGLTSLWDKRKQVASRRLAQHSLRPSFNGRR